MKLEASRPKVGLQSHLRGGRDARALFKGSLQNPARHGAYRTRPGNALKARIASTAAGLSPPTTLSSATRSVRNAMPANNERRREFNFRIKARPENPFSTPQANAKSPKSTCTSPSKSVSTSLCRSMTINTPVRMLLSMLSNKALFCLSRCTARIRCGAWQNAQPSLLAHSPAAKNIHGLEQK